jgi:bifunctional non-homologous end joining protein LigD
MAKGKPLDRLPPDAKARIQKSNQPTWVAPMLATLIHKPFSREGWLFEPKFEGERCLVCPSASELKLYSRTEKD